MGFHLLDDPGCVPGLAQYPPQKRGHTRRVPPGRLHFVSRYAVVAVRRESRTDASRSRQLLQIAKLGSPAGRYMLDRLRCDRAICKTTLAADHDYLEPLTWRRSSRSLSGRTSADRGCIRSWARRLLGLHRSHPFRAIGGDRYWSELRFNTRRAAHDLSPR